MSDFFKPIPIKVVINKQPNGIFDIGIYKTDVRMYYAYAKTPSGACKLLLKGLRHILPLIGLKCKIRFYLWLYKFIVKEALKS